MVEKAPIYPEKEGTNFLQISGSWFRASAITTINKTNKMHNSLKIF
jgi:hypothetical protein